MNKVWYERTLFYYDGPQVFEARDEIGGHYVAMMVAEDERLGPASNEVDYFLVAGVKPQVLREFRAGNIDLRKVFHEAPQHLRYVGTHCGALDELEVEPLQERLWQDHLPGEGFYLDEVPEEDILCEAHVRENLVLELTALPLEATTEHRIHVESMVALLHGVNSMLRHAYRHVLREQSGRDTKVRPGALMDVVGLAPGSVRVLLEASSRPDLVGSELEPVIPRMDAFFELARNPDQTAAFAWEHRGPLAGAYLQFLRFLEANDIGFRYSWAAPTSEGVTTRVVHGYQRAPLIEALSEIDKLALEPTVLEGEFDRFNRSTGLWGLSTAAAGNLSGRIADGGPTLEGLQVGGSYRFHCDAEMETELATGKETQRLYLRRYEPL